jgi:hypothetical protein
MAILDRYEAIITARDGTAPGVASARRSITQGMKGTGVGPSGAEAEKAATAWGRLSRGIAAVPANLKVLYHSGGLGRAVDELKEARRATDDFGIALRGFVPATAALAGLGTVAGVGAMLRDFGTFGTQLRNVAAPLAISTQDLERWQNAAGRAGVSAEAVASGFAQLNEKILGAAFGTDVGAVGLFNFFKIAPRDADGLRTVAQVIPEIFAAFKANSDPHIQHNILSAFGLGDLDPVFRRVRTLNELMEPRRSVPSSKPPPRVPDGR